MPGSYDHDYMAELEELLEQRRLRGSDGGRRTPSGRPSRAQYMREYRAGQRRRGAAQRQKDLRDALDEIIGRSNFTTAPQHWPTRHRAPDVREDVYPWRDLIRRDLEDADLL